MKSPVPDLASAAMAVLLALVSSVPAQEGPPEKVKKHYEMLLKRPAPGYLFDRFCNGWLDSATLDDLEKFLTARVQSPGTTADHLLLAYFHARQADSVKAIAQFRIALEKDPGSADAWYQKAVVEARTLNFDTALTDLGKAAAAKPRPELEITIRQFEARLLIRSGKPDKAAEVFRALLAARPGDEELREDMIELEVTEGLMDEAINAAQELISLTKDPQKKVLRRLRLGDILQRAGKREEAVDTYASTLAETGSDSWLEKEIISQIEQVFRREDDLAGLRERLQRMIAAEPKRLALRLAQARMLTAEGNAEPAMKAWQEILALTPGNRALREMYIEQMATLKKLPEAIAQMKELIAQHASDLELLPRLADLHFQNKDSAECLAALEQFIEKSDRQEGAWLRIAALMERYTLSNEALALLTKASAALPDSEAIAEAQAATLYGMDKKAEALAVWKKLAAGKSRERTVQVARMAANRNEMEGAFEILHARLADFENDPLFLGELTATAVRVKREAEALPWARRRIALTSGAADLEPALDDAVRIIATLDKEQEVIRETSDSAAPQELSLAAAIHESLGNPKRAEELLGKVTAAVPELGGTLQVRLFTTRGEPLKAAEALKKVVELPEGRKTAAVQRLVDLYQRAGRIDEALTWTAEWKRLSPGAVQPWETEAHLLQLSGRTGDALKSLRQAAQMFPDDEDLKAGLARRYREDGRLADAQRLLEQLYEDGKDPGAKLKWVGEMAQTAEQQGRMKELVESFEERRRTNRGSTLPLLALSEIYRTAGSYEERRAALLEAARLKPDDLDLLMEIARIEQTQGELASAQETLRRARQLDQSNRATQKLAEVLFAAGKDAEAVKMMEEIDTAKRLDPAAVESLAISVIGSGEWERAEAFLRPLTAKYPDNYRLHYLYALMLEETGQNAAAHEWFLKMLGMEKELQGARPPKHREMYAVLRRHAPEAAVQIMDMMNSTGTAYTHRQRSSSGGSYYTTSSGVMTYIGGSSTPVKPYLPSDLHELRTLALQHLAGLAQSMEEQAVVALKKDLASRGIVWAEHLTDLTRRTGYSGSVPSQVAAMVKAAPGEDYALALLCLNMTYNAPGRYAPQMRGAYARFRERYPQVAAMALLALLRHDDAADLPLLKEGTALVAGIEQPIDQLSYSLNNVTWMAATDNTSLKPERREIAKAIAEKLEGLYAAMPYNSPTRQQLQQSIFQACTNRHDWPRMVQLMEQELAAALTSPPAAGTTSRNYYYNDNQFILEPPFPPRRLPQVPATIANRWGLDDSGGGFGLSVPAEETEKFKAAARACREPVVRILLALRLNDEPFLDEMMKSAREAPEPGAAICTIMAGWHAGRSEPDQALAWLRRTQFLPLTRDDRAIVDRYLLGVITLGGLNPAPDTPDFTAARDAVVRLRQTKLDNPKREAMAAALNALGLTDDADKLLAANLAASRQSTPVASRASTTSQAMDVKIEALIKQGSKERAMTLLLRELRMAARAATGGSSYRDADAMIRLTKRLSLKDEVLPKMKPLEGATTGLAEYGWLLNAFDDNEAGKAWYEMAVAARPRDLQLRLTAAGLSLNAEKPDVEAAWRILEGVPSDSIAGMEYGFVRFLGRTGRLDTQMANLEIIRRLLDKFRNTPGLEWNWVINMLESNVHQSTKDKITLPYLYTKPGNQKQSLTRASKLAEWEAQRRTLHDDICRLMMGIPELRSHAFQCVAGLRLAEEKDGDDLVAMAREALLTKRDSAMSPSAPYYGYDESGQQPFYRPTPGDYLAEAAFKRNDRSLLDSAAAELEKLDQLDAAKLLRAQAELFFCPASEFEAVARGRVFQGKKEDRVLNDAAVVHIWKKRDLPPVLSAVLLEQMTQSEANRRNTVSLPVDYLAALATKGHRDKVEAFLSAACTALLGPAEKRADFLKQNWNPRSYAQPGTPGFIIRAVRQALIQAAQREGLAVMAVSALNDELYRYFDETRNDDYYGSQMIPEGTALRDWPSTQQPERMKRCLEGSPFLAELPLWRPIVHPSNKAASMLTWMLRASVRASTKPAVRKDAGALLDKYPDTFGRSILLAATNADKEESMRRSVLDLLASRRSVLESLPAERLAEIAVFANELAGDDLTKLKVSAEVTALLDWLRPKIPGSDELAVFLKPPGKWDKPLAFTVWLQSVRKALRLAAKESRERFHAVVARAKSMRIQGLSGAVGPQARQENSPLALAISSFLQDTAADRKKPDEPAFWNALIYAAEATLDPAIDVDWDTTAIDVQAQSAFSLLWRDCQKGQSIEETLTEFTARLAKVFTADQFRLYAPGFLRLIRDQLKTTLTPSRMQQWVASGAAASNPVAQECKHILTMEAARKGEGGAPSASVVRDYETHILTVARNPALSRKARLDTCAMFLSLGRGHLSPEVCREVSAMLLDAWQNRRSYEVRNAENVFNALLELPDPATRQELLRPLLSATGRVPAVRIGATLDEQLVAAAVQCSDKALLQRVAGGRGGQVHHGFLAAMIRDGAFDEARRWFEQHALAIGTKTGIDYAGWTPALAEKGAAFVKSLDSPHKAYLAEILIAMLPGSTDNTERTEQIRARMVPLAKQFGSVLLPDAAWRDRILELLATDDQVILEAAPALGPLAEKEPLSVLARIQGPPSRSKLRVLHLWIVNEFKQRRFGPFEQFLSDLNVRRMANYSSNSEDDPWNKMIRDTLRGTLHAAFVHSHEWNAEEREKPGAIYLAALQQKTFVTDVNDAEDVLQCALLYHALTSRNEALEQWWKTIPDDQQKKTRERFQASAIDVWLTKEDLDRRYGGERAPRLNFVKEYLANPVGLNGGDQCMDRPANIEWCTRRELLDIADDLLSRIPRNGDTGRQLAVVAEAERAWEKGADILSAAVRHLDKDRAKLEPRLLLQRALMLLQAGKTQEALTETEKLRPAVLDPFKDGKVETETLSGLATWIETHGRALMAAGRKDEALAFLGINPSVQRLAVREAGGNLSDAALHESLFRYAEAKSGIKVMNFVAKESVWRYRDSADAPPANWNSPDADDSNWASGPGKLGYGDPVRTSLSFGPDKNTKPLAAWFRTSFDVADPKEVQSLHLGVLRDDGCIVYLNGHEILRQNMPEGTVTHETPATRKTDAALENEYFPARLTSEHLVSGKNVIAVEVHQDVPTSSDLTFDLQLRGNLPDPDELMRGLDPAAIGPTLGDLWTALPEALRKALE